MTDDELRAAVNRYKWYHTIPLSQGVSTPGRPDFAAYAPPVLRQMDAMDFRGKRVIDIGCRDGLFSLEAERRGATDVLGIDTSLSIGAVEFLIPHLGSRVRMEERSLFELTAADDGLFDVVIFAGVLYHMRYPFLAIQTLGELLPDGGRMLLETALFADDDRRAMLFCPIGPESPYEPSSVSFYNRKGLTDTLKSFGLRVDATDYQHEKDRIRTKGEIIRGTFLCTKVAALQKAYPHRYWSGGTHKTWQKKPNAL